MRINTEETADRGVPVVPNSGTEQTQVCQHEALILGKAPKSLLIWRFSITPTHRYLGDLTEKVSRFATVFANSLLCLMCLADRLLIRSRSTPRILLNIKQKSAKESLEDGIEINTIDKSPER
ncbi:hypothetical protein J6590_094586 [Homalodisca vitripennis]|nr:hypothetical protein J6590_094586 [Homalodisca vitripennis]